jgi:hypothetical protein
MDAKDIWFQQTLLKPRLQPIVFPEAHRTVPNQWATLPTVAIFLTLSAVTLGVYATAFVAAAVVLTWKLKTTPVEACAEARSIEATLSSGKIRLTQSDIAKIPASARHMDIFVFLVSLGFALPDCNPSLVYVCFAEYIRNQATTDSKKAMIRDHIKNHLILRSGKMLFTFLWGTPLLQKQMPASTATLKQEIKEFLESSAAKQLSWYASETFIKLEQRYKKELGADHELTLALQQEWLPQLKATYKNEKNAQKQHLDALKEELMMVCWHPTRVAKYLEMGLDVEDM